MTSVRYTDKTPIGQGMTGRVSKHYDTKLGIHVAIKITKPKFGEREAQILAQVLGKCDYIPKFYRAEGNEHNTGIVMEYAPGDSLSKFDLTQDREMVLVIYKCVAEAVQMIHSLGIIHRDIKPDNIVVNLYPLSVKLVDWGFACSMTDDKQLTTRYGTPLYSAPELYYRVPYVDVANDMWSLGVSLFVTTMNRYPIDVEDGERLRDRFINALLLVSVDWTNVTPQDKVLYQSIFVHYMFRLSASQFLEDLMTLQKSSR